MFARSGCRFRGRKLWWICAACVAALLLSTCCLLMSLHDGGELLHDVLARGHLALDEVRHKLRTSTGWFGGRCSLSEPVFFITSDGGVNAAMELAVGCPRDAFVVLQRAAMPKAGGSAELRLRSKRRDAAPGWSVRGAAGGFGMGSAADDDSESQHAVIESLAAAATTVRTFRDEGPAQHLRGLHVAHISPAELCEAAACDDHYRRGLASSGDAAAATAAGAPSKAVPIAYFRVAAVVMRAVQPAAEQGGEVQHVEIVASRPVMLRVPVPFAADSPSAPAAGLQPLHRPDASGLDSSPQGLLTAALGGSSSATSSGIAANDGAAPFRMRLGLVSDSQSGARTFRHVLGHMALVARADAASTAATDAGRTTAGSKGSLRGDVAAAPPATGGSSDGNGADDGAPLDLLLHGGDTQQSARDRREAFLYLLGPIADLYTSSGPTGSGDGLGYALPTLLARGNHDDEARHRAYTLPPALWEKPVQQGDGQRMSPLYYELQWGRSFRVVLLDSDDEADAQVQWLQRTCKASAPEAHARSQSEHVLRLALAHIPPFVEYWEQAAWDSGESRWSDYTRLKLLPLLQRCQRAPVHMLVSGHSHLYQRGKLQRSSHDVVEATAVPTLHIATIGGGGGALEGSEQAGGKVTDAHVFTVTAIENHFVVAQVAGEEPALQWRAIGETGEILDDLIVSS